MSKEFYADSHQLIDSIAIRIREILFDDASDMMQGAMVGSPIECLAFAEWWIQRQKGMVVREDVFSHSLQEEQACKSIQAELDNGEELAKLLAKHLIAMGSCGTNFDVEVDGNQFHIAIRSRDNVMKVTDSHLIGEEELTTYWYRCPACDERVEENSSFCHDCGVELDWSECSLLNQ